MPSESSYYDRPRNELIDGSAIFQTYEDRKSETEVAQLLAEAWACNVRSFGALAVVDWYAERHGRLIGILELKTRSHPHAKYPTVFLNVRKWFALTMGSMGMRVPAIYVVRFDDGVRWVPLTGIDPSRHRMAGCAHIVKNDNDIEPVIDIPIEKFALVAARQHPSGTSSDDDLQARA